jgi:hypothetical protein
LFCFYENGPYYLLFTLLSPYYKNFGILFSLIVLAGLGWFFWDDIKPLLSLNIFRKRKPGSSENIESNNPDLLDYPEEYGHYFKEIEVNEELYNLEQVRTQAKGKTVDYSDINLDKWIDSPTTPKAGSSKLPSKEVLMIPIPVEE